MKKFLTILLLLSFVLTGCGNEKTVDNSPPKVEQSANDAQKSFSNGQFKVGADLPAGEYIAIGTGYVEIATTPEGGSSIVVNDNIIDAQRYVTARDGEYVKVTGDIKLYPSSDAPKLKIDKNLPAGQFKAGTDISAGEYKISLNAGGYFAVTKSTGNDYVKNQFTNDGGNFYATVADGQFLQIKNGTGEFVGAAKQQAAQPAPQPAKVLNLGMTLDQFKSAYNAKCSEIAPDVAWNLDDIQYKPEESKGQFMFVFSENVVMVGSIDDTSKVRETLITSTPKNMVDSSMALLAFTILNSMLNPELNTEQRRELFSKLNLVGTEQIQQLINGDARQVVVGNVKYTTKFVPNSGMFFFGAAAKDL